MKTKFFTTHAFYRNSTALFIVFALTLSLFLCSCTALQGEQSLDVTGVSVFSQEASSLADESVHSCDSGSTLPSPTDEDVRSLMDALASHMPGTAGSSLKLCKCAFAFLDFSEEYDLTDIESFKSNVKEYLEAPETIPLADGDLAEILKTQTIPGIKDTASILFSEGIGALEELIEASGNPNKRTSYNKENYQLLMDALTEVVGEQ